MEIGSLNLYNWRDFGYVWHLLLNDSLQLTVFADLRDPVCYPSGVSAPPVTLGKQGRRVWALSIQ